MPGPISDSYDPEFGTGQNAQDVREAIAKTGKRIDVVIGEELKDILWIVHSPEDFKTEYPVTFTEQELRIIRFCLIRAYEEI